MSQLIVRAGNFMFQARFEEELACKTVAAFRKAMPGPENLTAFGMTVPRKGTQSIRVEEV